MAWTTDDLGTRRFTSPEAEGWTLTVYDIYPSRIEVDTGDPDTDVVVTEEGIEVCGETSVGAYEHMGVRFTVPWVIVREIVAFQASVQSHPRKG